MLKKIIIYISLIITVIIGFLVYKNYPKLEVVSSYAAKKMCSCTFISERSQESIQKEDLARSPLGLSSTEIDIKNKSVSTSVFGLHNKTAQYRSGIGCVLIHGEDNYKIESPISPKRYLSAESINYPYGHREVNQKIYGVNYDKLDQVIKNTFDPNNEMTDRKTRALLVIHRDTIIAEHYANGYDQNTEILGWSMTKSIMNGFVGMMVKDSVISIEDSSLYDSWKNDPRKNITLNNLLHMSSGLEWEEIYSEVSAATRMLFMSEDIVNVAKSQPLESEPGQVWEYSSGTSNLISGYLRQQFTDLNQYLRYPKERIFDKLNMTSAQMEIDESGNYIGSSYCYATPRDWARFGTLYLRDGKWNGEQLLPEGWVDYTRSSVEASGGKYGAHFWTNINGAMYPDAPHDLYSMNGFEGQFVYIIPSKDLIIVRMGLNENFDFNTMISDICKAVDYEN